MMRILQRLGAMSPAERGLVVEATFALALASFAIALFPFRRIAASARRVPDSGIGEDERQRRVAQVGWAVAACARRVPWRAKCFEQGLAAQWMLGRRRVPSSLHYGVAKDGDEELVAHVWLRSGQLDVLGCENSSDFTELARFPS